MKIGIIGAMPQEVALMQRSMNIRREVNVGLRVFYEGNWAGQEVVLALSRIGKVSAAITTLLMRERFGVDEMIFTGVAGAIDSRLRIGDVVIADRLIQHDMDTRPLFPQFEIPLLGKSAFNASLHEEARRAGEAYLSDQFFEQVSEMQCMTFGIRKPSVYQGLVVSGDQFIRYTEQTAALQKALPDALCTEMEGAAFAQACHELDDVPFAVIRIISDMANHSASVDFQRFIDEVAEYMTGGIVEAFLKARTQAEN
ncbi:MAG: 5'-methylthioadenosine/adenosylhomocysteine nucleosidase [Chthoniobacterales bacterium]